MVWLNDIDGVTAHLQPNLPLPSYRSCSYRLNMGELASYKGPCILPADLQSSCYTVHQSSYWIHGSIGWMVEGGASYDESVHKNGGTYALAILGGL